MNSSKLKWVLIVIFLAVNLFLFLRYKDFYNSTKFYNENEILTAANILNADNKKIKADVIPSKKSTASVLKGEISDDFKNTLANTFIKGDYAGFAIPNGTGYSSDRETLAFYKDNYFEYSLLDADEITENILSKFRDNYFSDSAMKLVNKLSEKIFPNSISTSHKMSLDIISSFEHGKYTYIKSHQLIDNTAVDGSEIICVFDGKSLVKLQGYVFFSEKIIELSADSLDIINVLLRIPEYPGEIKKIEEVYYPVASEDSSIYFTPSYKTHYSDSSFNVWDSTSCVKRK